MALGNGPPGTNVPTGLSQSQRSFFSFAELSRGWARDQIPANELEGACMGGNGAEFPLGGPGPLAGVCDGHLETLRSTTQESL